MTEGVWITKYLLYRLPVRGNKKNLTFEVGQLVGPSALAGNGGTVRQLIMLNEAFENICGCAESPQSFSSWRNLRLCQSCKAQFNEAHRNWLSGRLESSL